jgi:hypothetical protein
MRFHDAGPLRFVVRAILAIGVGGLPAGCEGKHAHPAPESPPSAAEVKALEDLNLFASRIHEWTLVKNRPWEQLEAAVSMMRSAAAVREPECDVYLLEIARGACEQYLVLSREAAALLVERGTRRADLVDIVSGWRSDFGHARAAMWALARNATPQEIELFDSIENAGFNGLDPGRFGGDAVDSSMGRGVAGWADGLSSMRVPERFRAVLEQAAPLCVKWDGQVSTEYLWNPYFRRALSEFRKMYELDPRGTLRMLVESPAFPVVNPGAPSPSGSPSPEELARQRAGWRERLVAFLPAPARDDWRALTTR